MGLINLSGNEEIEREIANGNIPDGTLTTKELAQFVSKKVEKPIILIIDHGEYTTICAWSEDDCLGSQIGKLSEVLTATVSLGEGNREDLIEGYILAGKCVEMMGKIAK